MLLLNNLLTLEVSDHKFTRMHVHNTKCRKHCVGKERERRSLVDSDESGFFFFLVLYSESINHIAEIP